MFHSASGHQHLTSRSSNMRTLKPVCGFGIRPPTGDLWVFQCVAPASGHQQVTSGSSNMCTLNSQCVTRLLHQVVTCSPHCMISSTPVGLPAGVRLTLSVSSVAPRRSDIVFYTEQFHTSWPTSRCTLNTHCLVCFIRAGRIA